MRGPSTLGVSLPSKWVKSRGIKKGDEIDLIEVDGNILIGTEKEAISETVIHIPTKEIPLDKDKYPDRYSVRTIVINALRKGQNKIKITFDSPKVLTTISSCVDEVLGYEITEQNSEQCIIDNVINLIEIDLKKHFVKFRHVITNFASLIKENIVDKKENFEEVKSTFLMVEKNYNTFCRFLMNNCQYQTREKIFLFEAVAHLYQASRNMFYASKLYNGSNFKLSRPASEYIKEVFGYVDKVIQFVASKDLGMIADLNIQKNKLTYHELNKIIAKNSKENPIILQLSFAARRMWDSVGPYVGNII